MQVTPSVYTTGILNPNMRVFDVTMHTEYGTSYNSYVVKGTQKTALIETAHATFKQPYLAHVAEALAGAEPDYLILNHCEPDHTGSVAALLERYPKLIIVISQAGAIYIKNIVNSANLTLQVVKDGDTLDLGSKTLHFISAPFLHWPDSMFTWLPAEKVVFTCDFLGAHYCEPQMFDTQVVYRGDYTDAVKNYFDCIFAPFKPYVLKGLAKLEGLDIEFACTSHGPILTKGQDLERTQASYRAWATPVARARKRIPLFYCSAYGNTTLLAAHIARGILRELPDAEVECYDINEHELSNLAELLNTSDAFLIGSPTINRDAVAPVWHLLAGVDAVNSAKKPVALFGSYGWSGEAFGHLAERLTGLKASVFDPPFKVTFVPTPEDLQAAEDFGARFAATLSCVESS